MKKQKILHNINAFYLDAMDKTFRKLEELGVPKTHDAWDLYEMHRRSLKNMRDKYIKESEEL